MTGKRTRARNSKHSKAGFGSLSTRMLFTWFMLVGFIFLFAPQSLTSKFQFAFVRFFRCPLNVGRNVSLLAHTQKTLADAASRRENSQLQNRIANLEEELLQKHKKVEKLLGLRDRLYALDGANLILADVITASLDGMNSKLIINRGKNDGLAEGQFVLSENSVIGVVSDVSSRIARVKLVTDPASNIAVKIEGLDIGRIMQGDGRGAAKVQLLSTKHNIEVGSDVYACKKPGFLDAPMKIGTVAQCKRADENPLLWDITVKPVCDVEKLNDVTVIVMNPQEQLSGLVASGAVRR